MGRRGDKCCRDGRAGPGALPALRCSFTPAAPSPLLSPPETQTRSPSRRAGPGALPALRCSFTPAAPSLPIRQKRLRLGVPLPFCKPPSSQHRRARALWRPACWWASRGGPGRSRAPGPTAARPAARIPARPPPQGPVGLASRPARGQQWPSTAPARPPARPPAVHFSFARAPVRYSPPESCPTSSDAQVQP